MTGTDELSGGRYKSLWLISLWMNLFYMAIFFPLYVAYDFHLTNNNEIIRAVFHHIGPTRVGVGFALWAFYYLVLVSLIIRSYLKYRMDRWRWSPLLLWYHAFYIVVRWPIFSALLVSSCAPPDCHSSSLASTDSNVCGFVYCTPAFLAFTFDYAALVPFLLFGAIGYWLHQKYVNKYSW